MLIELVGEGILATIDPDRGADILSLVHRETETDVLLHMPEAAVPPQEAGDLDPADASAIEWLSRYRGGWQTLVPVAGPARHIQGTFVGFHGEASISRWNRGEVGPDRARLSLSLTSVPIEIEREVSISGDRLQVSDTLTNRGGQSLTVDYVAHPAFGGDFLEGRCRISSGARTFTFDPDTDADIAVPGARRVWPDDSPEPRTSVAAIPPRDFPRAVLGWLGDLDEGWATVENIDSGLCATVDWRASQLPYAWVWQELQASERFPWFRQVRTVAIEPASCQSGGPERESSLSLGPGESIDIAVGITVKGSTQ